MCRVLSDLPDDPWLLQQRHRVGRCIQRVRMHHNLTQDAVYLAVPLNRSYYQDIEAGRANPSLDTLNGIARAIGVSLSDLVQEPAAGPGDRPAAGR
ncbi:helix-turn-helix domain-containing protein [Streptomyces europaeiscabiei]|uniref:helix-turn-helix domain-containing protein n=1 Tax=Streptomyces europaeiscabiei TaxID=146819 RepID=UPI0029C0951F|nr:helix-turn-helix transcriptional regulator [Streptomyces europaeiscabiei]